MKVVLAAMTGDEKDEMTHDILFPKVLDMLKDKQYTSGDSNIPNCE